MEAFMVAASAAAAATKVVALSASVAAAADAEDAAAAAATDKEATVTAKDAATTASAVALNAKKAAVVAATAREVALATALNAKETAAAAATAREAALAAALSAKETVAAAATVREAAAAKTLNAKEAAAIAVTAREVVAATAAAAMQASKKCKFYRIDDDQGPPRSGDVDDMGSVDLISRLPDAILGSIVSLLPTKEGARTQAISRQWGPLWRSAPLNLVADRGLRSKGRKTIGLISKIISEHLGPTRRFSLCLSIINRYDKIKGWRYLSSSYCYDKIEGWLKELEGDLEELELTYSPWFADKKYLLPSSTYRFAPKLRVAKFGGCYFPNLITPLALEFPCLKQLTLESVTISEEALQSMLSGCSALESLELKENFGFRRLCISSQTLKSIGFCTSLSKESVILQELVIKDTPCLERFLHLNPAYFSPTIQIISAPKLKVLGMLSGHISELYLGTTVFKKMHAVSLTTKMHTMRVLVVYSGGPNLDLVVNFLKCFPCLERLYVIFHSGYVRDNDQQYDPLDPIECLELHLKKVVLKNYDGTKVESIDFTKYLVLNAKVLKEMKITLPYHRQHNWFANQRRLLQIRNRASKDAQIELKCGSTDNFNHNRHTHDLSMAAPFDIPSRGCSKCNRGPF